MVVCHVEHAAFGVVLVAALKVVFRVYSHILCRHLEIVVNAEKYFVEWLCTTYHYPVVAEEQAAHCSHQTDEIHKSLVHIIIIFLF